MNTQTYTQEQDFIRREATADLVNELLDNPFLLADVENWALDNHGFTVENLKELITGEDTPLSLASIAYTPALDKIDWELAVRSLNEEFGYSLHSKRIYVCLHSVRVDELNRERVDLDFVSQKWTPGDDLEAFLDSIRSEVQRFTARLSHLEEE